MSIEFDKFLSFLLQTHVTLQPVSPTPSALSTMGFPCAVACQASSSCLGRGPASTLTSVRPTLADRAPSAKTPSEVSGASVLQGPLATLRGNAALLTVPWSSSAPRTLSASLERLVLTGRSTAKKASFLLYQQQLIQSVAI